MSTVDFLTDLFCRVDEAMSDTPKHPQAHLFSSEVVTLSLLFVLKGGGERAFYRWLARDDRPLFPRLPERTRLFRLFATHQDWTDRFLVEPTIFGVADSYGVELTHPYREQRRRRLAHIGRIGVSNHRWIVGGKLGVVLNKWGLVCAWGADTANAHDRTFHPRVTRCAARMIVFADTTFGRKVGNPSNMTVCARGAWNDRMLIETTFRCSRWSAAPSMRAIVPGGISLCAWLSPSPCSTSSSNGTASRSMSTAAPIALSPSLACDIMPLAPKVIRW